jgi:hypothetical protein
LAISAVPLLSGMGLTGARIPLRMRSRQQDINLSHADVSEFFAPKRIVANAEPLAVIRRIQLLEIIGLLPRFRTPREPRELIIKICTKYAQAFIQQTGPNLFALGERL